MSNSCITESSSARFAVVLVSVFATSCSGPQPSPPQQVQATNPTFTYNYRGDEELIKASQSAEVACSKYRSSARVQGISDTADGGKSAVFECVSDTGTTVPGQSLTPGQAYPYSTDQDLLDRTRNADAYCASVGSHHAVSTITPGSEGTKNVSFQCSTS